MEGCWPCKVAHMHPELYNEMESGLLIFMIATYHLFSSHPLRDSPFLPIIIAQLFSILDVSGGKKCHPPLVSHPQGGGGGGHLQVCLSLCGMVDIPPVAVEVHRGIEAQLPPPRYNFQDITAFAVALVLLVPLRPLPQRVACRVTYSPALIGS